MTGLGHEFNDALAELSNRRIVYDNVPRNVGTLSDLTAARMDLEDARSVMRESGKQQLRKIRASKA